MNTPPKPEPIFLVEGPDGAGKTTICQAVAKILTADGLKLLTCRAPGGTKFGEEIRRLVLDPNIPATAMALSLAFTAAEANSVAMYRERLADPEHKTDLVLADRGFLSNFAYRYADGISMEINVDIARAAGVILPVTHVFYLNVPAPVRAARLEARGHGRRIADRLEARGPSYQDKVTAGYEEASVWATPVDADAPVDIVAQDIVRQIKGWL